MGLFSRAQSDAPLDPAFERVVTGCDQRRLSRALGLLRAVQHTIKETLEPDEPVELIVAPHDGGYKKFVVVTDRRTFKVDGRYVHRDIPHSDLVKVDVMHDTISMNVFI